MSRATDHSIASEVAEVAEVEILLEVRRIGSIYRAGCCYMIGPTELFPSNMYRLACCVLACAHRCS